MDLLIQLNREEAITCIMVTHDRQMRGYAHRVLHMLDGKIYKLENIPKSVRAEADAALQAELNMAEGTRAKQENSMLQTEYRDMGFYSTYTGNSTIPI